MNIGESNYTMNDLFNATRFEGVDIFFCEFRAIKPISSEPINNNLVATADNVVAIFRENEDRVLDVIMEMTIKIDDYFILSIKGRGVFSFDSSVGVDILNSSAKQFAIDAMFPYMRSFVTVFTSNIGKSAMPVVLPPARIRETSEIIAQKSEENQKSE